MPVSTLFSLLRTNLTELSPGLNIYHIWTKRQEVKSILGSNTGGLGYNHYIRLFVLSGIDIVITMPFNIWNFTTWFPVAPWPGWKFFHSDWSQIPEVPASAWRNPTSSLLLTELPRWMSVLYGLFFFLLFGVGAEARNHYVSAWQYVWTIFCRKTGFSPRFVSEFSYLFLRSDFTYKPGGGWCGVVTRCCS
jgi:Pheromone A receptor